MLRKKDLNRITVVFRFNVANAYVRRLKKLSQLCEVKAVFWEENGRYYQYKVVTNYFIEDVSFSELSYEKYCSELKFFQNLDHIDDLETTKDSFREVCHIPYKFVRLSKSSPYYMVMKRQLF